MSWAELSACRWLRELVASNNHLFGHLAYVSQAGQNYLLSRPTMQICSATFSAWASMRSGGVGGQASGQPGGAGEAASQLEESACRPFKGEIGGADKEGAQI